MKQLSRKSFFPQLPTLLFLHQIQDGCESSLWFIYCVSLKSNINYFFIQIIDTYKNNSIDLYIIFVPESQTQTKAGMHFIPKP